MKTTIAIFKSVTYSVKAKKLLKRYGINVNLVKTDVLNKVEGCSHGIEFKTIDQFNVINILRENGLEFRILG